jgi:Tat protein translocase TatB subunit
MFGIGMPELLIILVVALIVVGPSKLPKLAKSLGKGLSEFRRAADEIKGSLTENETYKDITEIKSSIQDTVNSMKPSSVLDVDAVLEPKKPKEDFEARKQVLNDIVQEHEEAHQAVAQAKADSGDQNESKTTSPEAPKQDA